MNKAEMDVAFQDVFDEALIFHGFTDYMRDYELVIVTSAAPSTGIQPEYLRFIFANCVQVNVTTALDARLWARSLDDRLIDFDAADAVDGYVWGVKYQVLYPGIEFVEPSQTASSWSNSLGLPFYQVRVRTNGHNFDLVFSDLEVKPAAPEYSPFAVPRPAKGTAP